jgi:hypothetical protein
MSTYTYEYISVVAEFYLLGYNALQSIDSQLTYRRNMSPASSEPKNKPRKNPAWKQGASSALHCLFFFLEDGGDIFLRNVLNFHRTARRYMPQDRSFYNHCCENLKCYKYIVLRFNSNFNDQVLQNYFLCSSYHSLSSGVLWFISGCWRYTSLGIYLHSRATSVANQHVKEPLHGLD